MTYSKTGLALTESFENCVLRAYWDLLGKCWSIGWGHTGPEVVEGLTCTQEEADAWLEADIDFAAKVVTSLVHTSLTQGEFDAVVDFTYNAGSGNFAHSTMLKELNAGNFAMAACEFEKWDHAGGVVVAGLLRRRYAEVKEFQGAD